VTCVWHFEAQTYSPTEALACPHASYYNELFDLFLRWASFYKMFGSCVTNIFQSWTSFNSAHLWITFSFCKVFASFNDWFLCLQSLFTLLRSIILRSHLICSSFCSSFIVERLCGLRCNMNEGKKMKCEIHPSPTDGFWQFLMRKGIVK